MHSIIYQGPEAAMGLGNSKDTADQSPFLVLPAEIRNKIYRYSLVEGQPGDRIRGFVQPALTRVNRQIRLEALPMYYGQNRFLLSIPPITSKGDPNAWPNFNRMFRAFEAGSTGSRGTGSLRFIRDLKCAIIPTSADRFRVLDLCFLDFEGPKFAFDNTTCRNRWDRNAVFSGTGARAWHDWLSVHSFVGKYLNRLGVTDGRSVFRLIGIVIMIAKECPSATKEIHFHSEVRKRDGARGHPACVTWQPFIIHPSGAELHNKLLAPRNLELAVRHLHADGLVVVEDAVPHEHLDALNEKMVKDAQYLQSLGDKGPFNYNQGNLQQDPPPVAEYFYESIFTNPIATQVTSTVLGPRPKWTFCSANSAMPARDLPGSAAPQRQPVHSDADFDHPCHPFALVINIPLVTMTPENGSTEIWLGTHTADVSAQEGKHGERQSGRIKEELLTQRREVRGPSQPVVKKGSIVLRDLRLWHAGMPNLSGEVRVMLAMIHFAPWYRNRMRLQFGDDVKGKFAGLQSQLEIPVDWVTAEEALGSYLHRGFGNSYDFGQE